MSPADAIKSALGKMQETEDEMECLPTELAALGALLRLGAAHDDGLKSDECRGAYELLDLVRGQARRCAEALTEAKRLLARSR